MSKRKHNRRPLPHGPAYRFSSQYIWITFWLAWGVILALCGGAMFDREMPVKMADIVVPSMVALIACLLGIHRAFGSLDYRSGAKYGAQTAEEEADDASYPTADDEPRRKVKS